MIKVSLFVSFINYSFLCATNRWWVNFAKSGLWFLAKLWMDNLSVLTKSTQSDVPAQGGISGHTSHCSPRQLKTSHFRITLSRILRLFALVSVFHSGHNSCWIILVYSSGSRWPRCGQRVPDAQVTELGTKRTAQQGSSWAPRVARGAAPSH